MKASLESLLANSLDDLKTIQSNRQVLKDEPPLFTEADLVEATIRRTVADHDNIESDADKFDPVAFAEENEAQHRKMAKDIEEVRAMASAVTAAMEMMGTITSMESIPADAVETTNVALNNIAEYGDFDTPPQLVADDNGVTNESMESVVDWIVDSLRKMKKWIKEKWDNIALSFNRSNHSDAMTRHRISNLLKRISSIGTDYGIPSKAIRYAPIVTAYLYADKRPVPFTVDAMKAAAAEAIRYTKFANTELAKPAFDRSSLIVDGIGKVLMSRDGADAEKDLREMFSKVIGKCPSEAFHTYGKEVIGGVTFNDPHAAAPRPSRDVQWIAEMVDYINIPYDRAQFRKNGSYPSQAANLETISDVLDIAVGVMESSEYNDYNWHTEVSQGWREAYNMYERMVYTVNSVYLPHMSNELWRAVDVAVTAMFEILERVYNQIVYVRSPSFRFIQGVVYVAEEQVKAYAAVNR